jgi:hypothetical protein
LAEPSGAQGKQEQIRGRLNIGIANNLTIVAYVILVPPSGSVIEGQTPKNHPKIIKNMGQAPN